MTVRRITDRIYQGVFYLAAGLIYAAVTMRTFLLYRDTPVLGQVMGLLALYLFLFVAELVSMRRGSFWFNIYLILQIILVSFLIYVPEFGEDYFSLLYAVLGMQIMERISNNTSLLWILIFLSLIGYKFIRFSGPMEGLTLLLLFGSIIIFLASCSYAIRRAQQATRHSQLLMQQLQEANQQLEQYANTQKRLGIVRERQRLARELHDSVTQTIFSMTLTTQSAVLILDKNPTLLAPQLERLKQLAQSAMVEMHTLISELRPEQVTGGGLVAALRQLITIQHLPEGLSVTLDVDGDQELTPLEAQNLFRISQEALNNVVKHAKAKNVSLHVHIDRPYWIEINDDGQGFDPHQALEGGQIGLAGMHERAEEIGWSISIQSAPGEGTHIRVEKKSSVEEKV
ncbi:MAG TPA: sensor histidine kinase [Anaerolineales bacterium]|nr:sensor histidine kinase [Anaerolineales bacterium]